MNTPNDNPLIYPWRVQAQNGSALVVLDTDGGALPRPFRVSHLTRDGLCGCAEGVVRDTDAGLHMRSGQLEPAEWTATEAIQRALQLRIAGPMRRSPEILMSPASTVEGDMLEGESNVVAVLDGGSTVPLPHYVKHSPTGFAWGYGGSGPHDLAFAIISWWFGTRVAGAVYHEFARSFVAHVAPGGGRVVRAEVWAWLRRQPGALAVT